MACTLYTLQQEFCESSPLSGSDESGKNDMPWLGELTQWAFTDEFFNTQVPPLSSRVSHWVWGCCKTNWQKSEIGRVFRCQLSFPWQVSLHLISTFLAKDITIKYYSACTSNICTFTLAANISSLCQMSCSTCAKFSVYLKKKCCSLSGLAATTAFLAGPLNSMQEARLLQARGFVDSELRWAETQFGPFWLC